MARRRLASLGCFRVWVGQGGGFQGRVGIAFDSCWFRASLRKRQAHVHSSFLSSSSFLKAHNMCRTFGSSQEGDESDSSVEPDVIDYRNEAMASMAHPILVFLFRCHFQVLRTKPFHCSIAPASIQPEDGPICRLTPSVFLSHLEPMLLSPSTLKSCNLTPCLAVSGKQDFPFFCHAGPTLKPELSCGPKSKLLSPCRLAGGLQK